MITKLTEYALYIVAGLLGVNIALFIDDLLPFKPIDPVVFLVGCFIGWVSLPLYRFIRRKWKELRK